MIFEKQGDLTSKKEKFLNDLVGKVGADLAQVKKDINSEEIKKRVEGDMEEARNFGFNGTPGFLINGVSIRGAYPVEEFSKIIDQHLGATK
jgi:predicted DsbA family dithiol-disulfide isomerase